jgi:hypothetical protein
VNTELANKACAHLLITLINAINTAIKACAHLLITLINIIKANLFVYNIIAKLCYIFRGAQFQKLASEPAAVGQIARQLIQCGRLGQFRLASRLLYSG